MRYSHDFYAELVDLGALIASCYVRLFDRRCAL